MKATRAAIKYEPRVECVPAGERDGKAWPGGCIIDLKGWPQAGGYLLTHDEATALRDRLMESYQ